MQLVQATLLAFIMYAGCLGMFFNGFYSAGHVPPVSETETQELFVRFLDPELQGIAEWKDLESGANKSITFLKRCDPTGVAVTIDERAVTWGELLETVELLVAVLPEIENETRVFANFFEWLPVKGGISYTGYHAPTIRASPTKKPGYEQPIYAMPPERLHPPKLKRGQKRRPPYFTRAEIESGALAGRGLELAWAADPFDAFLLEVQGSGYLLFEDGTRHRINFAGHNGHPYKSSASAFRRRGLLEKPDVHSQRRYFREHPEDIRSILNENPSYVFFKLDNTEPTGSIGAPVEAWRSLAVDKRVIPYGSVVAYGTNIPAMNGGSNPLRGIGFAHDTGGAIKGKRIDIFCGNDEYADYLAGVLDARGPAWILIRKEEALLLNETGARRRQPFSSHRNRQSERLEKK